MLTRCLKDAKNAKTSNTCFFKGFNSIWQVFLLTGTFCHEFASQWPIIFLYAEKPQTTVARPAAVDRRSVADKQLNLNGRNPFSLRSSVPRAQPENVVSECSDHGSNPVQGTIFFSFLLFVINKAYF